MTRPFTQRVDYSKFLEHYYRLILKRSHRTCSKGKKGRTKGTKVECLMCRMSALPPGLNDMQFLSACHVMSRHVVSSGKLCYSNTFKRAILLTLWNCSTDFHETQYAEDFGGDTSILLGMYTQLAWYMWKMQHGDPHQGPSKIFFLAHHNGPGIIVGGKHHRKEEPYSIFL